MRAVITGAHGFVGQHLRRHLEEAGDDVIGTDRSAGGPDLADMAGITQLFTTAAPEVVYHLAGQADVGRSWSTPIETFEANANGTLHVLMAAQSAAVQRVLVVTSADVYGAVQPENLPLTETLPLRPGNPYAASKAAAEMLAFQASTDELGVVRARAFNHLGPGQSTRFVASALAHRIVEAGRTGATEIAVGNLEARRDFTDVRDVVRAYRLLATEGVAGEAYNVCSGEAHSIAGLVDQLLDIAGVSIELVADPDLQRPSDTPVLLGNPDKIRTATGWQPQISLRQTLADLLASFEAAPHS